VPHGTHSRELIERAIRVKVEVVSNDSPKNQREILNYGTRSATPSSGWRVRFRTGTRCHRHVYVAELARLAGRLDEQTCALHRPVLARGLADRTGRRVAVAAGGHGRGQEGARRAAAWCARRPGASSILDNRPRNSCSSIPGGAQ